MISDRSKKLLNYMEQTIKHNRTQSELEILKEINHVLREQLDYLRIKLYKNEAKLQRNEKLLKMCTDTLLPTTFSLN